VLVITESWHLGLDDVPLLWAASPSLHHLRLVQKPLDGWKIDMVVVSKHGNVTKNITKQEHVVKNYRLHIDFLIVT